MSDTAVADVTDKAAPPGGVSDSGAPPPSGNGAGTPSAMGADIDAPDDGGGPTVPQTWPDDWKEKVSSRNEAMKSWISRYGSVEAALEGGWQAVQKVRTGQYKRAAPGEEASPEEVAAYRKEAGIPEAPDKYDFALPKGVMEAEADKALLDQFKGVFHKHNLSADAAKGIVADYLAVKEQDEIAARDAAIEKTAMNRATLKAEMGKDHPRNIRLAKGYLDGLVGEDGRKEVSDLVLSDGTRLGDHPAFVKMAVQGALSSGDAATIVAAEFGGGSGGKSLQDQLKEASRQQADDPKLMKDVAHQDKIDKLAAAIVAEGARKAR